MYLVKSAFCDWLRNADLPKYRQGQQGPAVPVFCQIEAVQQNGAAPIGLTSIEQTQLACEIPIIPHIPSQERLFLRDISCESEVGGEKLHVSMPAWLEGIMAPRQTKAKLTKRKTGKPMLDWILKHG